MACANRVWIMPGILSGNFAVALRAGCVDLSLLKFTLSMDSHAINNIVCKLIDIHNHDSHATQRTNL